MACATATPNPTSVRSVTAAPQRSEAGRMYMSLGEALGRLGRQSEALENFDHARALFRGTE